MRSGNFHIGDTYFTVPVGAATAGAVVLLSLALTAWLVVRSRR